MPTPNSMFIKEEGVEGYTLHPLTTEYPGNKEVDVWLAHGPTKLLPVVTYTVPEVTVDPSATGTFFVGSTVNAVQGAATGNPQPVFDKFFYEKNGELIPNENGATLNLAGFADGDLLTIGAIWKSVINGEEVFTSGRSVPYAITVQPQINAVSITPNPLIADSPFQIVLNTALETGVVPQGTNGVVFTGSGTTWDSVSPADPDLTVTVSAAKSGWKPYLQILQIDPKPDAYSISRDEDYFLILTSDMATGEAVVGLRNTIEPSQSGDWTFDFAELQTGPAFASDSIPLIEDRSQAAVGSVMVGVPAVFAYTPRADDPKFDVEWVAEIDGVPQDEPVFAMGAPGAPGANRLGMKVTDARGSRTAWSDPVYFEAPGTMVRNSVRFNGTERLRHLTDPGVVQSFVSFAQFTRRTTTQRQAILSYDGLSNTPFSIYDGDIIRTFMNTAPSGSITANNPAQTVLTNERVSVLVEGHVLGSDIVLNRAFLKADGTPEWEYVTTTVLSRSGFNFTGANVGVSIGAQHSAVAGISSGFTGSLHRLVHWVNTPEFDITNPAIQALFLDTGTDDLMLPEVSYSVLGTPRFDLYEDAAAYNARKANGSIGTFDQIVGTFTNG